MRDYCRYCGLRIMLVGPPNASHVRGFWVHLVNNERNHVRCNFALEDAGEPYVVHDYRLATPEDEIAKTKRLMKKYGEN